MERGRTGSGSLPTVGGEAARPTFHALHRTLTRSGRFPELYTDRGNQFCRTITAGAVSTAAPAGLRAASRPEALRQLEDGDSRVVVVAVAGAGDDNLTVDGDSSFDGDFEIDGFADSGSLWSSQKSR